MPYTAGVVASWLAYCAASTPSVDGIVLRLWGLTWTRDEACCHFFVTGGTGTGKTSRAIVPIVHGLRATLPDSGILAIDSKGALWKPMVEVARSLGQENDLRLIRVRPPYVPSSAWTPPYRLNLLADPIVPWATYAKILVDTATAAGQRGGHAFFKETARDIITHSMHALDVAGLAVTLDNIYDVICVSEKTKELLTALGECAKPKSDVSDLQRAAAKVLQGYFADFDKQPPEQKAGTVYSVANFLRPYRPAEIAEVFSSNDPNFSLAEVDLGRLICLSIPQVFQVERKYLNLLCKQLFFLHAFRRFDLSPEELQRRNMIALVLDEGQKTTLVSEDGFSDHATVDELREAGVCLITATQTPLSFYASFETERKADVFMSNLRTQIHFRAADDQGAKMLSQKLGGRELRKYSGGISGGKSSRNWQLQDEPWVKPERLLALENGKAVIRHPRFTGRPYLRRLPFTTFTQANRQSAE
ncbi:MAG: type IV secretion system DNA-binding domain-containing protein [Opitutaceae bacterium]|nr:type IV secretion system DNA-binding domain-containing protein [Opitutaceae bacterium]